MFLAGLRNGCVVFEAVLLPLFNARHGIGLYSRQAKTVSIKVDNPTDNDYLMQSWGKMTQVKPSKISG